MIEFTKAFRDSKGTVHNTIEEAQEAEIVRLLSGSGENRNINSVDGVKAVANHLVKNRETLLDILTTTSDSRPKARKVNGGRKPRRTKQEVFDDIPIGGSPSSKSMEMKLDTAK